MKIKNTKFGKISKKMCIFFGLFVFGLIIYAIYKPIIKLPVFEFFEGYENFNLIPNGKFTDGIDAMYVDSAMPGSIGKSGDVNILSEPGPNSTSNVLYIKPHIQDQSYYRIDIPNGNKFQYLTLSAWTFIDGDSSDIRMFKINHTQQNGWQQYKTNGINKETFTVTSSITNTSNTWIRREVVFKIQNNIPIIYIYLGNIPKSSNTKIYFTDIKLTPFLIAEPSFPLREKLLLYLNNGNENSFSPENTNWNSLVNTYSFVNNTTVDNHSLNMDNILTNPSFSFTFKLKWNNTITETEYTLINYLDSFIVKIISNSDIDNDGNDDGLTSYFLKIEMKTAGSNVIIETSDYLTFDIERNTIITIIYDGRGLSTTTGRATSHFINIYNDKTKLMIIPSGTTGTSTPSVDYPVTSISHNAHGDFIVNSSYLNTKIISKLVIYNKVLIENNTTDERTELYNYLLKDEFLNILTSQIILPNMVDYINIYDELPKVTFEDGKYMVEVFENTILSMRLSSSGKTSYGPLRATARTIFISNFQNDNLADLNIQLPNILREGHNPTIDIENCPFLINKDNPCHTEQCYGINWGDTTDDKYNTEQVSTQCRKNIYDYCTTNKDIDKRCSCWTDADWHKQECKDYRNSLYEMTAAFADADIKKHPDIKYYMPIESCNCTPVANVKYL
jgi:hypothetical protein